VGENRQNRKKCYGKSNYDLDQTRISAIVKCDRGKFKSSGIMSTEKSSSNTKCMQWILVLPRSNTSKSDLSQDIAEFGMKEYISDEELPDGICGQIDRCVQGSGDNSLGRWG
jgi:hypothetical protein